MSKLIWLCLTLLVGKGLCECPRNSSYSNDGCYMGKCVDNQCACYNGWGGTQCDTCFGRSFLNQSQGFIYDGPRTYSHMSKCSWLIQPSISHSSLRLRFNEFATECGWDHLYVYDGDSAFAPLIGAFNGLLRINASDPSNELQPEIIARSGSAFLHFSSDQAFSLVGFNISYSVDECKYDCFQQGTCNAGFCNCTGDSIGSNCNLCDCSNNTVFCEEGVCPASDNTQSRWSVMEFNSAGRASYSLTPFNNTLWLYGGLKFDVTGADLLELDVASQTWEVKDVLNGARPASRYEHSAVQWNDGLLVFGGKLTENERTVDEMWRFDFSQSAWARVDYTSGFGSDSAPGTNWNLQLAGHTANLVQFSNGTEMMVVLFGYHPNMGFSPLVYEYNPVTLEWTLPRPSGALVRGLFGHTTVYDPVNGLIYIHGGMQSGSDNTATTLLTDQTISYNPDTRYFEMLTRSRNPRYLHSAVFMDGVMLVYGGSSQSNASNHDQCYSSQLLAYYVATDRWYSLPSPPISLQANRYGHQSAVVDGEMYSLSGFDSTMISNILVYPLPSCSDYSNENTCTDSSVSEGVACEWNNTSSQCVAASSQQPNLAGRSLFCNALSGYPCATCLSNDAYDCQLCGTECAVANAEGCEVNVCPEPREAFCASLFDCHLCETMEECAWTGGVCGLATGPRNSSACNVNTTCDTATDCGDCNSKANCMWCQNVEKCIPTNSYVLQFPYGQCVEWIRRDCAEYECSAHQTCEACQNHTECGWCDDGSMTGSGICMEGAGSGSRNQIPSSRETCEAESWFFVSCPPCQCNGHSLCDAESNCIDCRNNTTGRQCERCADGYYGNPLNGGNCSECQCGGKAESCNPLTGFCFCSTKGEIGMTCEECDITSNYFGDATENGTCYYNIQENYIFTFTLTPPGDEHVTAINFQNQPASTDDVDLSLTCDQPCNVRLGVLSNVSGLELTVMIQRNITSLKYNFQTDLYKFGESNNATIRIYVSNFTVPFEVKVSLLQYNNALLKLLLIIFSTLLAALILGAVIWKLKLMYDNHRMRATRAIQMKEMAARPFAGISLHCDDMYRSTKKLLSPEAYEINDSKPDVFCEETCGTGNAAVASVFLWLPSNVPADQQTPINNLSELYLSPPPGQSALAIGTVLINQQKKSRKRAQGTEPASLHV